MKLLLLKLLLLLRPTDEVTHACIDWQGIVYFRKSPNVCDAGDKWACDVGSDNGDALVCCNKDWSNCTAVSPPEHCLAAQIQICSA